MTTKGFTTGQGPVQLAGMDDYRAAALKELTKQQQDITKSFGDITYDTTDEHIAARQAQLGEIDYKKIQQDALKKMMGSSLNPGEYTEALRQMGNLGEEQRDKYAEIQAGLVGYEKTKDKINDDIRQKRLYEEQKIKQKQEEERQKEARRQAEEERQKELVDFSNKENIIGQVQPKNENIINVQGIDTPAHIREQDRRRRRKLQQEKLGSTITPNSVGVSL